MAAPAFAALACHLDKIVYALESGRASDTALPLPGSRAAAECDDKSLNGDWGDAPTKDANNFARLLCNSASDHVLALAGTLRSPDHGATSSFTVGRGLMEAASRAWYHLDPDADVRERVRRFMNERLWSFAESRRFLKGLGDGTTAVAKAEEAILRTAEVQNFNARRSSRGSKERYLGEPRPTIMNLCDVVLPSQPERPNFGSAIYRFLSASAHGGLQGLIGHLEKADDGSAALVKSSEKHARHLLWPLRAYVAMGNRFLDHYGWPKERWEQERDAALDFWVQHAEQGLSGQT